MTEISPIPVPNDRTSPAQQIYELRTIHNLVNELAGNAQVASIAPATDLDTSYDQSPSVVQQRFNAVASETAIFAAAGLSALITGRRHGNGTATGAALLAREMERSIRLLETILHQKEI